MAFKGNQHGVILKDPQVRQDAYNDFCSHLSKGKSIKSWFYEKDGHRCCWMTMLSYIKNEDEFDPITKTISESKGYSYWESIVEGSAIGTIPDANTACLQMLMRNKYGWDKEQEKGKNQQPITVNVNGNLAAGLNIRTETLSDSDNQGSQ